MSYILARTISGQLSSVFLNRNRTIAGIDVDVIFDYSHSSSVRITENPTESGVLINDHRIITPRRLTMNVGVSNTITPQTLKNNYSTSAIIQLGKAYIFGNSFDSKSRIALTYTSLESAMYTGEPFDVETPLGLFKNMLITSIEATNDSDTYGMFNGTISMQEFLTIESEAYLKTTGKAGVSEKEKIGQVQPESVNSSVESILPSSLRSLL